MIAKSGGRGRFPKKLVVAAVIVLLALTFVFQNTATGRVDFLFWSIKAPAWLWLLIIFFAGSVAGWLFGRRGGRRS